MKKELVQNCPIPRLTFLSNSILTFTRVFNDNDINWIKSLTCLKNCGMSIIEMKKYLELCLKGESTIPERKIILDAKLRELEQKKQEIQKSIDFVNWKQNFYNDVLSGKKKYFSYLINTENDDK